MNDGRADERTQVLDAARAMLHKGLTEGTAGNLSMRLADGNIVVTPASVNYETMTADDLVVVDPRGDVVTGARAPTSELALHLACYEAFSDIRAVVHAHPIYATMFAVARQDIPACIDELAIYCGGDVKVTEYARSGTADVGHHAVAALVGRGAALLANHGTVAVAANPGRALHITALVERAAQIVWGARALGAVHDIPAESDAAFKAVYASLRTSP